MNSSEFIRDTSREYGLYTLENRAIPALTDGLKQSQRIMLYVLKDILGEIKTVALAGKAISDKFYVHGDTSAAQTVSFLAAPYLNNYPLIQGEGNFGTRSAPTEVGAPRYTDVKKSKFAEKYLYVDLDILPMQDNYDNSKEMPFTFLPLIPLVLLNGVKGIAVGWSTNILPRRLEDVQNAVLEYLTTGEITIDLPPHFENFNLTIRPGEVINSWMIKGVIKIENTTTVRIIELPPKENIEKFINKLDRLEEKGEIEGYDDNTTDVVDIVVKFQRKILATHTEDSLIALFNLDKSYTEHFVMLTPDKKRVIEYTDTKQIIKDFVDWRLGWFKVRYTNLFNKEMDNMLFYMTVLACFDDHDTRSVVSQLATFKNKKEFTGAIINVCEKENIEIREYILEKITTLPSYRWTAESKDSFCKNLEDTLSLLETYDGILNSDQKQKEIYVREIA